MKSRGEGFDSGCDDQVDLTVGHKLLANEHILDYHILALLSSTEYLESP